MLSSGLPAQIHGRTQVGMQWAASPKLQLSWDDMPGISYSNLFDAKDFVPRWLIPFTTVVRYGSTIASAVHYGISTSGFDDV